VQRFRAALAGKSEQAGGWSGIEGVRLVEEALHSDIPVEAILVSESGRKHLDRLSPSLRSDFELLATTDRIFESVSAAEAPQGIAALVKPKQASFDDLLRGTGAPLVVVLVGVQDPGNTGTILRTAEAMGASGVAACRAGSIGTAHPFSPKVLRASAGSAFRLPILDGVAVSILQTQLRVSNIYSFAATSSREHSKQTRALAPWQADLRGPVAFFIGNEGAGLPAEVEHATDATIRIPSAPSPEAAGGEVESLNAAMAATILLYEAARQRIRGSGASEAGPPATKGMHKA
jgi:TrmH family RNA methyltransferase